MTGEITNIGPEGYYGGLCVTEGNGRYFWSCESYDGHQWEEISEHVYRALIELAKISSGE